MWQQLLIGDSEHAALQRSDLRAKACHGGKCLYLMTQRWVCEPTCVFWHIFYHDPEQRWALTLTFLSLSLRVCVCVCSSRPLLETGNWLNWERWEIITRLFKTILAPLPELFKGSPSLPLVLFAAPRFIFCLLKMTSLSQFSSFHFLMFFPPAYKQPGEKY